MATESLIEFLPLTVDIIKTVILIVLLLAVYTAHLDIQIQLHRYNRRKYFQKPKSEVRNRTQDTYKRFSILSDIPRTTTSFKNTLTENLLPNSSHTHSCSHLSDIDNLPPPAENI